MDSAEEHQPTHRFISVWKVGIALFGVGYTLLYFFLSIPRLLFPYEIEWLEGGMLDHAARIFQGKSLFAAPSIEMVNWLYQPIYYYAAAGAMHIFGATYLAGRFVSFASIIISACLIFFLLHNITKSWWYAFLGSSLLFGLYGMTGYWYEIAHVDTLMLVFLLASVTFVSIRKNVINLVLSALFLALAFFTKQQAIFFTVPIFVWLFLSSKRGSIIYGISFAFFIAVGIFLFSLDGGKWYFYFTFTVPQSMGSSFHWDKIFTVLPIYLFTQFAAGTLLILFFWITHWQNRKEWIASVTGLLTLLAIAAAVQLGMHLGHPGTYRNVAMPLAAMMALMIPLAAYHVMRSSEVAIKYFALAALIIQFSALYYSFKSVPLVTITKKDYEAGEAFFAEMKSIPGNVFFPHHEFFPFGGVKRTYANLMAAEDCHDVGDSAAQRFWNEWQNAYIEKKYDVIIIDEGPFKPYDSIPGYTFVRKVNLGAHPFVTRAAEATSIPRYLYLPKK